MPTARSPYLLIALLSLPACSASYVMRAGYEEAKILWRRQPIEKLLERSDLDADTRAKFELTLAVRAFARDTLHLRAGHSYTTFAPVGSDQVVHVVSAAYRLHLQPYTWWFPIVGRVPYKGFFSETAAREEAMTLEREGYDTYVRPSVAFSTLGWFADPLLSNLLRLDRPTLASVIVHELLHNTTYLAGHADFDESFANFVGDHGAILFFQLQGDGETAERAALAWRDALQFSDFLEGFTARLTQAYASGVDLAQRQRLFDAAQEDFRQLHLHTTMYHDFGAHPLNNAVILHQQMYAKQLRVFEDLFRQHHGDLERTINAVLDAVHAASDDPFAAVRTLLRPEEAPAWNVAARCEPVTAR